MTTQDAHRAVQHGIYQWPLIVVLHQVISYIKYVTKCRIHTHANCKDVRESYDNLSLLLITSYVYIVGNSSASTF